ncbi:MAG: hypothetical protein ACT4RN_19120 [Pseudonocardia sp.]
MTPSKAGAARSCKRTDSEMTSRQDVTAARYVLTVLLLGAVVVIAVIGWIIASQATIFGELLSWWLPLAVAAVLLFTGAAVVNQGSELPKIVSSLAVLALLFLLVRGALSFFWIGIGER